MTERTLVLTRGMPIVSGYHGSNIRYSGTFKHVCDTKPTKAIVTRNVPWAPTYTIGTAPISSIRLYYPDGNKAFTIWTLNYLGGR